MKFTELMRALLKKKSNHRIEKQFNKVQDFNIFRIEEGKQLLIFRITDWKTSGPGISKNSDGFLQISMKIPSSILTSGPRFSSGPVSCSISF